MNSSILILSFNNQGINFYNHHLNNTVHSVIKIDRNFIIADLKLLINQVDIVIVDNYFKESSEGQCLATVSDLAKTFEHHEILMLSSKFIERNKENLFGLHNLHGFSFNTDFLEYINAYNQTRTAS